MSCELKEDNMGRLGVKVDVYKKLFVCSQEVYKVCILKRMIIKHTLNACISISE
jgi:hypothetical protein